MFLHPLQNGGKNFEKVYLYKNLFWYPMNLILYDEFDLTSKNM